MKFVFRALLFVGLLGLAATSEVSAQQYRYQRLDNPIESDPRCVSSHARWFVSYGHRPARLSDGGVAVGAVDCYESAQPGTEDYVGRRAFAWSNATGGYFLSQEFSIAVDANQSGTIVGYEDVSGEGVGNEAVRWVGGVREALTNRAGMSCPLGYATAVNHSGAILGFIAVPNSTLGYCVLNAVARRTSGQVIAAPSSPLGYASWGYALNDSGIAAISHGGSMNLWNTNNGTLTQIPDSASDRVSDIDNSSAIVGHYRSSGLVGCKRPTWAFYRPAGGSRQNLRPVFTGASFNMAHGINERGQIVGTSGTDYSCAPSNGAPSEANRAVLWNPPQSPGATHTPVDLNSLISPHAGVVFTEALDINENGAILASGYYASDALLPCPVTEERFTSSGQSFVFNASRMCRQMHLFRVREVR